MCLRISCRKFQNNCPVFLFKAIFRHSNYFLSSVDTDDKDGHGLTSASFFKFLCYARKKTKTLL